MEGTACSAKTFAVVERTQSVAIAGVAVATVVKSNAKVQAEVVTLPGELAAEAVARSREQD